MGHKVKLHRNKPPTFLLLYAITNGKTVKLMQVDRLLSASKTSPAETRYSNSGRYTLLKSHTLMRNAERWKVIVLELKCLRSLVGVS